MKTIKKGEIPKKETPWWVGKRVKCSSCGAESELELEDEPYLTFPATPRTNPVYSVQITCNTPGCLRILGIVKGQPK